MKHVVYGLKTRANITYASKEHPWGLEMQKPQRNTLFCAVYFKTRANITYTSKVHPWGLEIRKP